eukprot:CAMPEP_0170234210 /NCGR_PEP_ID=MMETSP0116_2-20130129/16851_1 /TAXON_ID=400756 /ORGANISM="Durinskia baltica, Strain CSIRO CS-38" /LENGTH=416 /DNA_ID=CAMNT_0010485005 /DNA_START=18 /DNA_END=1265 /DNA_ORIENTATION=-
MPIAGVARLAAKHPSAKAACPTPNMGVGGCCGVRAVDDGFPSSREHCHWEPAYLKHVSLRDSCAQLQSLEREWEIVSASISQAECHGLHELRDSLQDLGSHPSCAQHPLHRQAQTLIRFLRGRDGDVRKADAMFRASMDWRHEFQVEAKIQQWRAELSAGATPRSRLFTAYGSDAEICLDKFGVPMWLMRLSVSDPAGMLREVGQDALLVNSIAKIEGMHSHLRRAMFREGKLIRGCVQIIDVGDYGDVPNWWSRMWATYNIGRPAFKVFDSNYPETTRKVFIVRMGSVTTSIYKLVKPIIPPRTNDKMRIFGHAAVAWADELRGEVPEDVDLPQFLCSDDAEALRVARPVGGMIPLGGDVPDELLRGVPAPAIDADDEAASCDPGPRGGGFFRMRRSRRGPLAIAAFGAVVVALL